MSERDFIQWLRGRLTGSADLTVGPGDDAAEYLLPAGRCVVTTDLLTDGIDFRLDECDPRRAGRKALAVNLSDLAAMAARPLTALVALALPDHAAAFAQARELYEGLLELAQDFGITIAGGDTNTWPGRLVVSVTAIGQPTARGSLLRSGARPGDQLVVTGAFGGSILGKHFDFTPRVAEALHLHENYRLSAGTDVSDGLSLDAFHLAEASGCGLVIQTGRVPVSADAVALAARDPGAQTPLEHALEDGEDFELALAVPADQAARLIADQPLDVPLTAIGHFVPEPGLWFEDDAGQRTPAAPRGYQHGER